MAIRPIPSRGTPVAREQEPRPLGQMPRRDPHVTRVRLDRIGLAETMAYLEGRPASHHRPRRNRPRRIRKSIKSQLSQSGPDEQQALVYWDGFNVSFDEAAIRAAQIGFDLKVPVQDGILQLAVAGIVEGYAADAASIEASEPAITDFLVRFATDSGAARRSRDLAQQRQSRPATSHPANHGPSASTASLRSARCSWPPPTSTSPRSVTWRSSIPGSPSGLHSYLGGRPCPGGLGTGLQDPTALDPLRSPSSPASTRSKSPDWTCRSWDTPYFAEAHGVLYDMTSCCGTMPRPARGLAADREAESRWPRLWAIACSPSTTTRPQPPDKPDERLLPESDQNPEPLLLLLTTASRAATPSPCSPAAERPSALSITIPPTARRLRLLEPAAVGFLLEPMDTIEVTTEGRSPKNPATDHTNNTDGRGKG